MGRDCVPMRELSIVGRVAQTIVEMNAVAVYAAHGDQLTIRCAEALILAIRKQEELVTRSYLYGFRNVIQKSTGHEDFKTRRLLVLMYITLSPNAAINKKGASNILAPFA